MSYYLKGFTSAFPYDAEDSPLILEKWGAGCPRPLQRAEVLKSFEDGLCNLILFGQASGVGKTTTAFEWIFQTVEQGAYDAGEDEHLYPMAVSGLEFARKVAKLAKENSLDSYMQELCDAELLLLDDLDKKANSEGKLSPTVQQALYELIERRTALSEDYGTYTCLTLNSSGEKFASKFDDDIAPYLMRRLRERFKSINFDVTTPTNVLPMEKSA